MSAREAVHGGDLRLETGEKSIAAITKQREPHAREATHDRFKCRKQLAADVSAVGAEMPNHRFTLLNADDGSEAFHICDGSGRRNRRWNRQDLHLSGRAVG